MKLVLIRHGNTFAASDKVVWVGARSDLPLVQKGKEQAEAVGRALADSGLKPSAIYCGPLKRTVETADIAMKTAGWTGIEVTINDALREIDYGLWEARSNDDIRKDHGDDAIDGWQKSSIWPEGFGWSPDPATILANWNAMIAEIEAAHGPDATAIIVTSNGILRIVSPHYGIPASQAKVGTGCMCLIEEGKVRIWNARDLKG
ncbi:histidine phosphatase family protein [Cohaesibacter haloalkalitolerans]|uniref:histidine phosphatase family protein n=1 Tax=Cohaesibacter haloalkalitolerans TaxID=1162980 RepID=UPI000E64A4A1|nr:histidine phosphatase family protein [Cohaesibacter haloalkalitolerans]